MSPSLPDVFPLDTFDQTKLQAYEDCQRRFWLSYIQQLPWPAVGMEPVQEIEHKVRLGELFHQLVVRAEVGIDPALLAAELDEPLRTWFEAYRRYRPADLPTDFVEVEKAFSIPYASGEKRFRLVAKYDLVAAEKGGRVVIVDWKTNERRTPRNVLQRRLQTIVYPYVLVEASPGLMWGTVEPEQVEMRFWFVNEPDRPEVFRYSAAQHAANRNKLQRMLENILAGTREEDFPKVPDTEQNLRRYCNFCVYRSRCNRGVVAGMLDALDEVEEEASEVEEPDTILDFSLAEVDELAF